MDFAAVLNIALPVVYVLVGCVLVWFAIELALLARSARSSVNEVVDKANPLIDDVTAMVSDQVDPLLEKANALMDEVQPAAGRVDPIVENASLTVEALNLELMRVDQILEDVTQITGSVSKAAGAVDTVTNAPLGIVNSVTDKIRTRLKPQAASSESIGLGEKESGDKSGKGSLPKTSGATSGASDAAASDRVHGEKA